MRQFIKEPFVHFTILGAALFGIYAWSNRGAENESAHNSQVVRITQADVEWLKTMWSRQWHREPGPEELRGLVADLLKEELLALEAQSLGLHEDDTIVRRRLAQKMEFLVKDTARLAEPSDEELRLYFADHSAEFQIPARISFTQIFFDNEEAGGGNERAAEALAMLNDAAENVNDFEMGDRSLLEPELIDVDGPVVAGVFGEEFSEKIFALEPGEWHGPIESSYGLHLVRISHKEPSRTPEFDQVREQVAAEWRRANELREEKLYYAALLEKYEVLVDESVKPLVGALAEAEPEAPRP